MFSFFFILQVPWHHGDGFSVTQQRNDFSTRELGYSTSSHLHPVTHSWILSMASMDEIPKLLSSSYNDSFIGPVVVAPSRVLELDLDDVDLDDDDNDFCHESKFFCGDGLFCTESVLANDPLILIRPYSDIIINIDYVLQDIDCGRKFQQLIEDYSGKDGRYGGGKMLAMAGWLAKRRICDMFHEIKTRQISKKEKGGSINSEEVNGNEELEFLTAYISALPWHPKDQDHVIWWRQDEADELLRGCEGIVDESSQIRREVASAIPLLAAIIGPVEGLN